MWIFVAHNSASSSEWIGTLTELLLITLFLMFSESGPETARDSKGTHSTHMPPPLLGLTLELLGTAFFSALEGRGPLLLSFHQGSPASLFSRNSCIQLTSVGPPSHLTTQISSSTAFREGPDRSQLPVTSWGPRTTEEASTCLLHHRSGRILLF